MAVIPLLKLMPLFLAFSSATRYACLAFRIRSFVQDYAMFAIACAAIF